MKCKSGFSQFELMVVIAIIAVGAALTIPNLIGWYPKYRLGSAARDILSTFQASRASAVKDNTNVVVTFDVDNNGSVDNEYMAFVDNGAIQWVHETGERIVAAGEMPAGVQISSAVFNGNPRVGFNNRGMPFSGGSSTGGTVQLTNSRSDSRQITLWITGNSTIN